QPGFKEVNRKKGRLRPYPALVGGARVRLPRQPLGLAQNEHDAAADRQHVAFHPGAAAIALAVFHLDDLARVAPGAVALHAADAASLELAADHRAAIFAVALGRLDQDAVWQPPDAEDGLGRRRLRGSRDDHRRRDHNLTDTGYETEHARAACRWVMQS